jgi:hypothetical protein
MSRTVRVESLCHPASVTRERAMPDGEKPNITRIFPKTHAREKRKMSVNIKGESYNSEHGENDSSGGR